MRQMVDSGEIDFSVIEAEADWTEPEGPEFVNSEQAALEQGERAA